MKLPITENEVRNAIIELLQYQGYFTWRQNTGAAPYTDKHGEKRWVKFGQAGFSDIFAIQPVTGKFVCIEVKRSEKEKPKPEQVEFIRKVNAQGGIGLVAWSTTQVAERLNIKGLF